MNKKIYCIIVICMLVICVLLAFIIVPNDKIEEKVDKIDNAISKVNVPILMYHHFTTDINECNDNIILVDKFKQDMKILKNEGYTTISFKELYDFVENDGPMPKKPIIISIDDGYLSNYEYAYSILKDLDMKACIFEIGKTVGNVDISLPHFSYSEAKEMYESGYIDIQSHTYNLHNIDVRKGILKLDTETEEEYISMLANDLMLSKNGIESNIGNSAFALSYPYGLFDTLSLEVIKSLGFKITVVTDEGINIIERNNLECLYNLKRINVTNDIGGNILIEKLQEK